MIAPFLIYLTVFQSRLGSANLVLPLTSYAHTAPETLERKITRLLTETVEVDLSEHPSLVGYLASKKYVGPVPKRGTRYPLLALRRDEGHMTLVDAAGAPVSKVTALQIDLWMSDPRVVSTVGVPTPENAGEILLLCFSTGMLTANKHSWTAAAQAAVAVRNFCAPAGSNPFVRGPDSAVVLRQLMLRDGPVLAALMRRLRLRRAVVRDEVALELPGIVADALEVLASAGAPTDALREGRRFAQMLVGTAEKRDRMSRAPGVLEHRMTPRLEWLCDLGVLTKSSGERNAFKYEVTSDCELLHGSIDASPLAWKNASQIAIEYWRNSEAFRELRSGFTAPHSRSALRKAYQMLRRPIGPAAIAEVCFVAAMFLPDETITVDELRKEVLRWASESPDVKLSGGRFRRTPEMMYVSAAEAAREDTVG